MALRTGRTLFVTSIRCYSSARGNDVIHHKLVVAGGGTGGCSVSARACRTFGPGTVAVIEPSEVK